MKKELLENVVNLLATKYMFLKPSGGFCTHLVTRKDLLEISQKTGKALKSANRDWSCGDYTELIPGIDSFSTDGDFAFTIQVILEDYLKGKYNETYIEYFLSRYAI